MVCEPKNKYPNTVFFLDIYLAGEADGMQAKK